MAVTIGFDTSNLSFAQVVRATSGGTVFSANYSTTAVFDYFTDTAVVDDCLYMYSSNRCGIAQIRFDVGTPIVATDLILVWEYYNRDGTWHTIEDLQDDTNGFTTVGLNHVNFSLQWEPERVTLNGTLQYWFRCRIDSVTSLTEGGANITNTVRFNIGQVYVIGATEIAPAILEDIYQWVKTNHPYISIAKVGDNVYDFTRIALYFASPVETKNEVILLGQNIISGSMTQSRNYLYYLRSGELLEGRGMNGSVFVIYGTSNSSSVYFNDNTECYGTTFRVGPDQAAIGMTPGYANLYGKFVDCWLELAVRPPSLVYPDAYVSKCQIVNGLMIVGTEIPEGSFDDIHIIQVGAYVFYCYTQGFTVRRLSWIDDYASIGAIIYCYQASGTHTQEWIMLDPKQELPLMTDSDMRPVKVSFSNKTMTACRAESGGIYTDYTAEIIDFIADDVPLSGNVGDSILFGISTSYPIQASGYGLNMTITTQSNDYVYVWEYYDGSSWHLVDLDFIKDGTHNFTGTGVIFLGLPVTVPNAVIDGTNAKWCRVRITSKGSGSPTATQAYQYRAGGNSNWSVQEKYSFNMKVIDAAGNPIENARVDASDENGNVVFSVTTDIDGLIEEQSVLAKEWHLDPDASGLISENVFSSFNVSVYHLGYESVYFEELDVIGSKDIVASLKRTQMLGQGRIS